MLPELSYRVDLVFIGIEPQEVTCESSNEKVAKVSCYKRSSDGTWCASITTVSEGNVVITTTTKDEEYFAKCTVTVSENAPSKTEAMDGLYYVRCDDRYWWIQIFNGNLYDSSYSGAASPLGPAELKNDGTFIIERSSFTMSVGTNKDGSLDINSANLLKYFKNGASWNDPPVEVDPSTVNFVFREPIPVTEVTQLTTRVECNSTEYNIFEYYPENADVSKTVKVYSENEDVLTLNGPYSIKGVSLGTTKVFVKLQDRTEEFDFEVLPEGMDYIKVVAYFYDDTGYKIDKTKVKVLKTQLAKSYPYDNKLEDFFDSPEEYEVYGYEVSSSSGSSWWYSYDENGEEIQNNEKCFNIYYRLKKVTISITNPYFYSYSESDKTKTFTGYFGTEIEYKEFNKRDFSLAYSNSYDSSSYYTGWYITGLKNNETGKLIEDYTKFPYEDGNYTFVWDGPRETGIELRAGGNKYLGQVTGGEDYIYLEAKLLLPDGSYFFPGAPEITWEVSDESLASIEVTGLNAYGSSAKLKAKSDVGKVTVTVRTSSGYSESMEFRGKTIYTFDPNGGNWSGSTEQKLEKGYPNGYTYKPSEPERQGYVFLGWTLNGEKVSDFPYRYGEKNLTYVASWTPRTDIPYSIEYYLENANDDDFTKINIPSYYCSAKGTMDTLTDFSPTSEINNGNSYLDKDIGEKTRYAIGNLLRVDQQTIKADGSTVVKVYYSRQICTYTFYLTDERPYTEKVVLTGKMYSSMTQKRLDAGLTGLPSKEGCVCLGWKLGDRTVTEFPENFIYTAEVYRPVFKAVDSEYTVKYYFENIDGTYSENEDFRKTLPGAVGSQTVARKFSVYDAEWKSIKDIFVCLGTDNTTESDEIIQQTVKQDKSTVIEIYYRRKECKYYINLHGGTISVSLATTSEPEYEYEISGRMGMPTGIGVPVRTGYIFSGWMRYNDKYHVYDSLEILGITKRYNNVDEDTYHFEGSICFDAAWTPITYTVVLAGTDKSFTCTYDTEQRISYTWSGDDTTDKYDFKKKGYNLAGFSLVEGSTEICVSDNYVRNLASEQGATVTLYPVWTPRKYEIALYSNNAGSSVTKPVELTYDQEEALPANVFTKPGYTFIGWAESWKGDVVYEDCAVVKNLTTDGVKGNQTLYAVWQENRITVNVTIPTQTELLGLGYTKVGNDVTLTAETGYGSYAWYIDGAKQVSSSDNTFTINLANLKPGKRFVMVVAGGIKSATYVLEVSE